MDDHEKAALRALGDRVEIAEVIMRYCRAIDRGDEAMLRTCFHPDSTHRHGGFTGPSSDFCAHAMAVVAAVELTHHQLGQISIDLDGDLAHAETYFTAYHRFGANPPPGGRPHEDRIVGGRYLDRLERRAGAWRIARRHGVSEWRRYEAAADRGFFDEPAEWRGRRDKGDSVYVGLRRTDPSTPA
ncbi:nuclear transport factor 2 family protein [Phenylobacterium montanum]|uniref:Nuclear transport factor 2 family protein n=1 Tax=Phenylobacterium montanum TaxID=2823693 RepID=A0A975G489_9CAUL|nr:nuclear transport factor 2 family protein [Caulobacter sp. S6]QUD90366.1 nuclear transport factor 2 family protein [Caulobacter sp. S6]